MSNTNHKTFKNIQTLLDIKIQFEYLHNFSMTSGDGKLNYGKK